MAYWFQSPRYNFMYWRGIKLPFHKLHTMLRVRKPYTYIIAGECFMAVFENDIKNILDKWQLSW